MQLVGKHAIVIGGSMGGLLAARALADAFEQVTLFERDEHPDESQPRKGVPQGRHVHGLLARGREVLEVFFPGLTYDLLEQGALKGDLLEDCVFVNEGAPHVTCHSGLTGVVMTRPLLESTVRRRLLEWSNVTTINGADVHGLVTADGRRVTGVRWAPRGQHDERTTLADLVVDATGRGSRTPAWLEAMGYGRPIKDVVPIDITYTTRFFRRRPGELVIEGGTRKTVLIAGSAQQTRGGVLFPQEGQRWIAMLGGILGDTAPTDLEGFRAFARTLASQEIYDVIRDAEPLGEAAQHRFKSSTRHRYERLSSFPERYLVFGDAICSFNPVYGQGMTVAAVEALELREVLEDGLESIAQRFFRRAAKAVDVPWSMVAGGDLRFPQVPGRRTPGVTFSNWYVNRVHQAARTDPTVAIAFQRVANLLDPPTALMRPRMFWRVLRGGHAGTRPSPQARAAERALQSPV